MKAILTFISLVTLTLVYFPLVDDKPEIKKVITCDARYIASINKTITYNCK